MTRGKFALVDDEDFEKVSQFKWYCHVNIKYRQHTYARRSCRDREIKKSELMHRFILNVQKNIEVDHINGDGLDNRKQNLRLATKGQNAYNSTTRQDNKTGFKGVTFNKAKNKFVARININKKPKHLGYFNTAKEAADSYNKAARKLRGEFARLNKIND